MKAPGKAFTEHALKETQSSYELSIKKKEDTKNRLNEEIKADQDFIAEKQELVTSLKNRINQKKKVVKLAVQLRDSRVEHAVNREIAWFEGQISKNERRIDMANDRIKTATARIANIDYKLENLNADLEIELEANACYNNH